MPPPTTVHYHPPPPTTIHHHPPPPPTTIHQHPPLSTTTHHHPPTPTTVHHYPPPYTTTHQQPKYIHHHPPQSKIYPSKKVFYKKNIKFFYPEVRSLTNRTTIAKKLFFFTWPSLSILLRTQEMVSVNKPLYYAKLVYFWKKTSV